MSKTSLRLQQHLYFFKAFRVTICQQSLINLITVSKTTSTGFMFYDFFLRFYEYLEPER